MACETTQRLSGDASMCTAGALGKLKPASSRLPMQRTVRISLHLGLEGMQRRRLSSCLRCT
jgi:hypothetical protein